jgi:tRNA uridine 5-carbamoylmethylation protein Kti12
VAAVQAAVAMGASVGESVRIPKSKIPVLLSRKPTLPELSRIRRQFIKVNTMHPDDDLDGMTSLFVEYINKVLAT